MLCFSWTASPKNSCKGCTTFNLLHWKPSVTNSIQSSLQLNVCLLWQSTVPDVVFKFQYMFIIVGSLFHHQGIWTKRSYIFFSISRQTKLQQNLQAGEQLNKFAEIHCS